MKVILKNNKDLHFIEIHLFKNKKYLGKKEHISKHQFVENMSNIDEDVEHIVVEVPNGLARLNLADSIDKEGKDYECFLYSPNLPLKIKKLTISKKQNGSLITCISSARESDVKIMDELISLI